MATVENIITHVLGEHEPGSAQNRKLSREIEGPHIYDEPDVYMIIANFCADNKSMAEWCPWSVT